MGNVDIIYSSPIDGNHYRLSNMFTYKKNKFVGIYSITSPSGKIYIGQSINIVNRWRQYKYRNCKEQPHLYNSILKYGFENHSLKIHKLFWSDFDQEHLDSAEINLIALYQSRGYTLLNLTSGGRKTKFCKETRDKMRRNTSELWERGVFEGKKFKAAKGFKWSEEDKKKLRDTLQLRYGEKWRLSKLKAKKDKEERAEWWKNNRAKVTRFHCGIPVVQLSLDGKFIKFWDSQRDAAEELKISQKTIRKSCIGIEMPKQKYRWVLKSNYKND